MEGFFLINLSKKPGDGVTFVSIAIDNASLLRELVKRRKSVENLATPISWFGFLYQQTVAEARNFEMSKDRRWTFCRPTQAIRLLDQLYKLNESIRTLLSKNCKAVAVFCAFETERAQRNALHCLSTGRIQRWANFRRGTLNVWENAVQTDYGFIAGEPNATKLHSIHLLKKRHGYTFKTLNQVLKFRGTKVLKAKESCEPNDVRWADLQVPSTVRTLQYLLSTTAMIGFVSWSGFFIRWLEASRPGSYFTPLFITATNLVVPSICEVVNAIESHSTEASLQASLYTKVALFRWFNSAVALTLAIGFTETISLNGVAGSSLGEAAYNLICAEMFSGTLIRMCDVVGFYRKHIQAPRAYDQEEMNACFVGIRCELAERYTDVTKILCVSLFFAAILPQSLLLGAAAMMVHYCQAKFALLRMGRASPDLGPRLSRLSRNVFFSGSLVLHMVMSAYWWSGYPYDNVCESRDGQLQQCNQDFLGNFVFPPLPRRQTNGLKWMTSSQGQIVSVYGWTALGVVGSGPVHCAEKCSFAVCVVLF